MVARYAVPLLVGVQQVYELACDNFVTSCDKWDKAILFTSNRYFALTIDDLRAASM